jgi:hypothetical protein
MVKILGTFALATLCIVSASEVEGFRESIKSTTEACKSGKLTDLAAAHSNGETFTWEENNAKWTCVIKNDGYECNVSVLDASFALKSQSLADT